MNACLSKIRDTEEKLVTLDKLNLNLSIPTQACASYQEALETGDLLALRTVLLSVCSHDETAMIKEMLPMDMIMRA